MKVFSNINCYISGVFSKHLITTLFSFKNSAELTLLINDETVDIEQEIHGAQRMLKLDVCQETTADK